MDGRLVASAVFKTVVPQFCWERWVRFPHVPANPRNASVTVEDGCHSGRILFQTSTVPDCNKMLPA